MAKITKILALIFFFAPFLGLGSTPKTWNLNLESSISKILSSADGNYGIYIKSLSTGEDFSLNAERSWYLASAIKLAVANELYKQIAQGKIRFEDTHIISLSDYRDGAGKTNFLKVGGLTTIRQLTEQMLIESDNTATDILINRLGIDNINKSLGQTVPRGFSPISTMLDVRRLAYSEFNAKAGDLSNMDFFSLKKIKPEGKKISWLKKKLNLAQDQLKVGTLREAFERYYEVHLNSGTLRAYAQLLIHSAKNSDLMKIMSKSVTGDRRLSRGLPRGFNFAHKTGTQLARICDMGIIYKNNPQKGLIVTVCAEKFKSSENAEKIFQKIGKAINDSGALTF
ncbi:MAG: hypothetical protein A4S09_03105 [Proteobacteria bacterium SG_bin7]|nr:MAG: hypothetical protein A4S09_03105 [Proteobacteria bacterium SG_bin7]